MIRDKDQKITYTWLSSFQDTGILTRFTKAQQKKIETKIAGC